MGYLQGLHPKLNLDPHICTEALQIYSKAATNH